MYAVAKPARQFWSCYTNFKIFGLASPVFIWVNQAVSCIDYYHSVLLQCCYNGKGLALGKWLRLYWVKVGAGDIYRMRLGYWARTRDRVALGYYARAADRVWMGLGWGAVTVKLYFFMWFQYNFYLWKIVHELSHELIYFHPGFHLYLTMNPDCLSNSGVYQESLESNRTYKFMRAMEKSLHIFRINFRRYSWVILEDDGIQFNWLHFLGQTMRLLGGCYICRE